MTPIRAIATTLMSGEDKLEMVEGDIIAFGSMMDPQSRPHEPKQVTSAVFALDDGRLFEVPIKNLTVAREENEEE